MKIKPSVIFPAYFIILAVVAVVLAYVKSLGLPLESFSNISFAILGLILVCVAKIRSILSGHLFTFGIRNLNIYERISYLAGYVFLLYGVINIAFHA